MIHITVTSQETEIRMSISNTRKPTKAFIIPPHMNGAKDIKNYIDEITIAKQRIRDEFDRDLKKQNAIVEKNTKPAKVTTSEQRWLPLNTAVSSTNASN